MTKTFVEILKETWEEQRGYFENYKDYCLIIKREAERILGEVKVIVFGSIVRRKFTPNSDIDILIISDNLPSEGDERRRLICTKLKSSIGRPNPFQLHLVTQEEFEIYYKPFIKDEYIYIP